MAVTVQSPPDGDKQALRELDPKMLLTPAVSRTLHMYHSVLRILCEAFDIETDGLADKCESALIAQVDKINKQELFQMKPHARAHH